MGGDQYFPLPGAPHCYIHCAYDNAVIKACPSVLVWNQAIQVCDWPATAAPVGNDIGYGSLSYGGGQQKFAPSSYGGGNNYAASAPLPVRNIPDSGSSYSYGRKKRSTTERKKRGNGRYNGNYKNDYKNDYKNSYSRGPRRGSTIISEVPLGKTIDIQFI